MEFRNIFCVGRNYADHALELGNAVPDKPLIFSKPLHSLVLANGEAIHYPGNKGAIHHELEIVLYIGEDLPDDDIQVDKVVTKMALGIDLTLRDVQSELKKKGHPWLLAKGFKNAAIVTDFWDFPGEAACKKENFSLLRDGQTVQDGNITSMIFSFQTILAYIQANFGLRKGDIIFTGTPEGVGPISNGEKYELYWGKEGKGSFRVHMS
ncbi:fumarylacetoacetate hydrolase family protein [Lederbergia galactosidilytica]|uniref:Fumarylacetoacetate hydrolase n=1 Tax=Lederbergia galactosidilytica TaxID=217031 RepID=A0A177ZH39_9BACI|nr:fumarylacetoacetate hydrolase family protein [Lederbergia galactosidilytica]KRG16405.1 fumarylacetoacetate hydrolase [Virgibacillus soli]MBP1914269.1 2-keto-4-pentenoate hydratase/2-oxohepta-3-ene-1,7-dioic acid hydratase in catechol pathway [Lederbergia galactosidilytica]OAK67287.1 fumarylacetoacetate hydrolase [Lederbergia galactosidilytica]